MTREQRKPVVDRRDDLPAEADMAGKADPTLVAPEPASGGLGGFNDGTQVVHKPPTAVPGKPMSPEVSDPVDRTSFQGQAEDTPASSPHAERGGTG